MGRPRKFKSKAQLEKAWEAYRHDCNDRKALAHEFSAKNGTFVSAELKRSVTCTIEGFCVYSGIARSAFYEQYANDDRFTDIVTRMREECEIDAREKFELGLIAPQLAGLWMSKYGYHLKADANIAGGVPVIIHDDLPDSDGE